MNKNKVAFLDRDGVINEDFGYVHLWQNFEFCDGVIDGMINLINLDFKLIIITNQSGIDRGLFSEYQYLKMTNLMLNHLKKFGVEITDIFYCPHHPNFSNKYFSNCNCRKPKPGLFIQAIKKYNVNINESISIGDSKRDLIASKRAGIKKRYLISNKEYLIKNDYATDTFKSLLECSKFLQKK